MDEKKFRKILGENTEETKRHQKILLEEFSSRLCIVAEVQTEHGKKLDATFEKVGKLTEDMDFVKDELRIIRNELKEKVARDEFVSLEKRVLFLEKKFRTA